LIKTGARKTHFFPRVVPPAAKVEFAQS